MIARAIQEPAAATEPDESSEEPTAPKAKILIVDDDERTALAVRTALEELGQTLVVAHSGEEALHRLLFDDYAVILLDVNMPGMDGYEMASFVRARKRTRHIPIVFLTALFRDDTHLLQAYSAGAVDMVFKPVDPFILRSKVAVFVDLYLKQAEIQREAELRHRLQEENFRVRAEKLTAEQALRRSQEHQEAMEKAEAHQRTLIEELNHRVKNMLTVVNAMARQTLASNPAPEDFTEKFVRRIDALGRTHSLLSREQWGTVQLCEVARDSLEPYLIEDKNRVVFEGPPVAFDPKTALALGIVFHELATNAIKHGALSNREGIVAMSWGLADNGNFRLQWQERGGPQVAPPERGGFGSRLIRLELTHELNGEVELIYEPQGLKVLMGFPLSNPLAVAQPKQGLAS
ncbi:MAG TPA: HWE histidine kinase domain-containing protein [Micropepsaceae bacterium]|nr:HWE histidine kinase domain-containing protein [Micropepsaceae bacterium]